MEEDTNQRRLYPIRRFGPRLPLERVHVLRGSLMCNEGPLASYRRQQLRLPGGGHADVAEWRRQQKWWRRKLWKQGAWLLVSLAAPVVLIVRMRYMYNQFLRGRHQPPS